MIADQPKASVRTCRRIDLGKVLAASSKERSAELKSAADACKTRETHGPTKRTSGSRLRRFRPKRKHLHKKEKSPKLKLGACLG